MSSATKEILLGSVRSTVAVGKVLCWLCRRSVNLRREAWPWGGSQGWPADGSFLTRLFGDTEVLEEESLCLAGDDQGRFQRSHSEVRCSESRSTYSEIQVKLGHWQENHTWAEDLEGRMWPMWQGPLVGNLR